MSRYIEFKDLKESKVSLVGKRAAILADLYKSGYPVQKGIIVVSKIFKEFLALVITNRSLNIQSIFCGNR